MQRCVSSWLLASVCALSVGCGEPSNMAQVSGTVSIDGKPVEKGSISFISVDGMSPTAGGIIEAGEYTSQAPLSEAKVEIRVPKVVGKQKLYDTPDSPVQCPTSVGLATRFEGHSHPNIPLSRQPRLEIPTSVVNLRR